MQKLIRRVLIVLCIVVTGCLVISLFSKSSDVEQHIYRDASGKTLPYQLLEPKHLNPEKKYPLVIFLHGAGQRGTDNQSQLKHGCPTFLTYSNRENYPCFLIAPQCPENDKWNDCDWGAISHKQTPEMTEAMRLTVELIESVMKNYPVDPKRVYLTGLSMGGYGTWDLLARRPDLFAAAVPICGGADESTAEKMKSIPIWAFHGAKDNVVPPERSRRIIAALHELSDKAFYTEYPEAYHDSWTLTYNNPEVFQWLFEQRKPD